MVSLRDPELSTDSIIQAGKLYVTYCARMLFRTRRKMRASVEQAFSPRPGHEYDEKPYLNLRKQIADMATSYASTRVVSMFNCLSAGTAAGGASAPAATLTSSTRMLAPAPTSATVPARDSAAMAGATSCGTLLA